MLYVRDLMQTGVVTVTPDATARDLARLLEDQQISGAPVMDGETLVGVVSSSDLVRLAAAGSDVHVVASAMRSDLDREPGGDDEGEASDEDPYGFFLPEDTPLADRAVLAEVPESRMDTTTVADIMTPISFTVSSDAPIDELCDFLVRGRIHRAVVVDDGRLVGIVTSADVLRAVADGRLAA